MILRLERKKKYIWFTFIFNNSKYSHCEQSPVKLVLNITFDSNGNHKINESNDRIVVPHAGNRIQLSGSDDRQNTFTVEWVNKM